MVMIGLTMKTLDNQAQKLMGFSMDFDFIITVFKIHRN